MNSSQRLVKFVIGCWACPETTLVHTKEKMLEWPHTVVRGPQKIYLKAYIIHWHGSMSFVVGEAKKVLR